MSLAIDEKIRWLQITVQNTMVVTVGHAHQQLVQKAFQYWYIKTRVAHIEIFLQILIQKLKDQSEFPFGVNYIVQSHNIRVLEFFQSVLANQQSGEATKRENEMQCSR